MISSTTLLLATLVFNAATGFGAPIRIPTASPDVVVRAVVDDPILPRVEVVDVQPVRKRSVEGNAIRPRFAREEALEVGARDTASSESVSVRDSLPEIEEIVRRYPRQALYRRHVVEKRSPEPAPNPPSDPALESRSTAPEPVRRFARRALYDRHAARSEPSPPEARSEGSDPDPHFVRRENPELFEKRSAPTTDNFPREPEPAPAPEPVPEPAPVPKPAPEPSTPERRRVYPRRILAERYEKRQETAEPEPPSDATATPGATEATSTTTSSASSSTATSATSPSPSVPGVPQNLDFNKVIADAIVSGQTNTVKHEQGHKITDYKETKITIQIVQQQNSDVKLEPNPNSSSAATTATPPAPTGSSTPTGEPSPSGSPAPTGTSTPSSSPTPTGTGASTDPTGSGTGAPTPSGSAASGSDTTGATADTETKPEESTEQGGAGSADNANASSGNAEPSSGSQPGGGEAPAEAGADNATKRDLDNANTGAEPIAKRHLGLAGSLLASWTRRNVQN